MKQFMVVPPGRLPLPRWSLVDRQSGPGSWRMARWKGLGVGCRKDTLGRQSHALSESESILAGFEPPARQAALQLEVELECLRSSLWDHGCRTGDSTIRSSTSFVRRLGPSNVNPVKAHERLGSCLTFVANCIELTAQSM